MSQSSGGPDELWVCKNPDCPVPPSIPLSMTKGFTVCPFCKMDQNESKPFVEQDMSPLQRKPLHGHQGNQDALVQATSTLELTDPVQTKKPIGIKPEEPVIELTGTTPPQGGTISEANSPVGAVGEETSDDSNNDLQCQLAQEQQGQPKVESVNKPSRDNPEHDLADKSSATQLLDSPSTEMDVENAPDQSEQANKNTQIVSGLTKPKDDHKAKELGPLCQFCEENLLTPTARICEHCKMSQRKVISGEAKVPPSTIESSPGNSASTSEKKFKYSPEFGPKVVNRPPAEQTTSPVIGSRVTTSTQGTKLSSDTIQVHPQSGDPLDKDSISDHDESEVTVYIGDYIKKNQRKRSSSVSFSRDQVKHFKSSDGHTSDDEVLKPLSSRKSRTLVEPGKLDEVKLPTSQIPMADPSSLAATNPQQLEVAYIKPTKPEELFKETRSKKKNKRSKNTDSGKPNIEPPHIPNNNRSPVTDRRADTRTLSGLNAPKEKSIEVVFHVIIPKPFWEWNQNSEVYLHFGRPDLGEWETDIGVFIQSEIDENLCEMTCPLRINADILKFSVPYKYVVYTQKSTSRENGWYEFIRRPVRNNGDPNRALSLNNSQYQLAVKDGLYHQFDTMAFPNDDLISKGLGERFVSGLRSVSSFLWGKKDERASKKKLEIPSLFEIRQQSLLIYLAKYEKVIVNARFSDDMPIARVVHEISHIYFSMLHCSLTHQPGPRATPFTSSVRDLHRFKMIVFEWLKDILMRLQAEMTGFTDKQLMSAVCIIWCISKLDISFSSQEVKSLSPALLNLLCAQQIDAESQQWLEYNYLRQFMPVRANREEVSYAIQQLSCESMGYQRGTISMHWINGIPLFNFLSGLSEPFDSICSKDDRSLAENWTQLSKNFQLNSIRSKTATQQGFVKQHFANLNVVFQLDPLSLQAFIYICPDSDLCSLFEQIPPHVCVAWLSYLMTNLRGRIVSKNDSKKWTSWIHSIEKGTTENYPFRSDPSVLMDSSVLFFKRCTLYLKSPNEHIVDVIKAAISLALSSIAYFHETTHADKSHKKKLVDSNFLLVSKLIKDWINNREVIGGKMFGCQTTWSSSGSILQKGPQEIEIWKSFLSIKCSCPKVNSDFQEIIQTIMTDRVNHVPESSIVKLLLFMEGNSKEYDLLTNVVMNAAIIAAEEVLSKPPDRALTSFNEMTKADSRLLGRVLGTSLMKKYPQLKGSDSHDWITLEVLLEWVLWPNFVKIVQQGNESLLSDGLPPECHLACVCASSKFEDICHKMQKGDVSLDELDTIKKSETLVKRLCEAVTSYGDRHLSHSAVISSLDQRLKEFHFFSLRRKAYLDICNWITDPKCIAGIAPLKVELEQEFEHQNIGDLCRFKNGQFELQCLKSAEPLDSFVDHFVIMRSRGSILFLNPLDNKLKLALTKSGLTVADVYPQIWKPTFEFCMNILNSLANQRMTLAFVDRHLKPYASNLKNNVFNLAAGISKCSQSVPEYRYLKSALKRVEDYWKLCEYREGAQVFLELRDTLKLKGDFGLVEHFSAQLTTSMKDQSLAAIDENLVDTGYFLEEIAKDPRKNQCLQTFAKCQDVTEWLRKSTKDVNDIQGFVTVALATAAGGEGDLAHDKLSHLRTVGSGFASFIYDVKETDGYLQLKEKCKSLWEALEKNSSLPKLLEDCNQDLSWYQSVKETQGSVETTSYGQMANILKYGCYRVGLTVNKTALTVHDLISVTLTERHKKLIKTTYSLDELRDLESKLVLICGNKADTRAAVDHYLNLLHSATRIAELYLDLQRAGDVMYSTALLRFKCAVYDVPQPGVKELQFNEKKAKLGVTALEDYTKTLEGQLVAWRESVNAARENYYELNYFTTLQLLHLRKELGLLAGPTPSNTIKPGVLMLLESVSPGVTGPAVLNSVQSATSVQDNFVQEMDTNLEGFPAEITHIASNATVAATLVEESAPIDPQMNMLESSSGGASVSAFSKKLQVKLTVDDLSAEQKDIYTNCVSYLGHSESHVLRAFQECDPSANMYDIEQWCDDNDDVFRKEENQSDVSVEDNVVNEAYSYSDESDQEDMVVSKPLPLIALSRPVPTQVPQVLEVSPRIKTVARQTVDESHPHVQTLLDAGYDLQLSIEAVDQFGDVEAAMNYLDSREEDGEEGGAFQSGPYKRTDSAEESMEQFQSDEMTMEEHRDPNASKSHLELDQLGCVLRTISKQLPDAVILKRSFHNSLLKPGHPNLLVTSPDDVLRTALALYVEDKDLPLPTHEEVLVCNPKTTTEEVSLLWRRAIHDPHYKRVFCLAHAEKLSYQVCDAALRSLSELSQGMHDYRLVIVCSKEDEEKSHIISKLHLNRRPVVPKLVDSVCRGYLKNHFVHQPNTVISEQVMSGSGLRASLVDPENSCVRVVSSTRSGMGKSLYIQRRAQELKQNLISAKDVHVTIPIHGPVATADILLDFLKGHMDRDVCTIYHLDIAPSILMEVDCILFSLLILNGLSDSRGNVWKCHPSHLYVVEVTLPEEKTNKHFYQTLNLLTLLPTVQCVSPRDSMSLQVQDTYKLGMDEIEFRGTTIQRVYQYLRRHAAAHNLDTFSYHSGCVEGHFRDFLTIILSKCGIRDPSWSEIHHFTKFLDIQLNACELSVFCDETFVGDVMSGLKGFVVKFMIRMSQDFSTPSLEGVLARENLEEPMDDDEDDQLVQYQIVERRQWEQNSHPYIFFNQDGMSITFVGFMVTQNGDLIDPANRLTLEPAIMRPQLYAGLKQNRVNFDEDYRGWRKDQMISKIATVMGIDFVYDPDDTYVLTTDNLIKILAIQMRFRCDIPVVIMGETGCGKTRLIRYMCDLARQGEDRKNMLILKIHGGITDQDVTNFVTYAENIASKNKAANSRMDTVVFFDEANTTDSIGLIKEIMCDRRLKGRPISRDLKFIAACNPYRKHTDEMIEKLETAGLGFYVRVSETQQKLGKIPLRQLVYRVLDLPPSMRPLVYDFGQLNTGTEQDYTSQIVKDHVQKHPVLSTESPSIIPAIAIVLAKSQEYMRAQKNECSFVSLRDVERAMIVFEYFYEKMNLFAPIMDQKGKDEYDELYGVDSDDDEDDQLARPTPPTPNGLTRALILSLSVCYHARLQDREPYEKLISRCFRNPLALPGGAQQFRNEIKWCQQGLLDNMELGPNIAKNAALRENVFMMSICIELRIPLFLVGKPGSSKSLAKSIIQDSMHGQGSKKKLLKEFKQVHIFSYQCSQLSTPESVIEVFKTAEKIQAHQDTKQYVSVVVLDEVGLAEDSPTLPLKALHPLLEDGTEGAGKDHQQKIIEREKRVAFIGISNWALDPAKMNRGVMVTRGDPGLEELKLSARGICSTKDSDPVRDMLKQYFEPLSQAYMEICKKQKKQNRQFFGLRDYYSLIKMLYWMCNKSEGHPLSWPQLEHAIRRNFGGLESDELNPFREFERAIGYRDKDQDFSRMSEEMLSVVNPDCSRLGLIKTSLNTKDTTWHGENRYLLFLTENYAALDILKHYLNVGNESSDVISEEERELTSQPFVLFGSSFPKDKEYTQVCRNINQIKICMETGRTVILLNLENLYESLYDVLNQYYLYSGGNRYVDLGLQTHRVKCRVHDNFKLILIAEKNTVYEKFPTPLINRLEKHFVLTSSVLEEWQRDVLGTFEQWVKDFSHTSDPRGNRFKEPHAFIGHQKDTPAAVVFQATNQLKALLKGSANASDTLARLVQACVLKSDSLADLAVKDENSNEWTEAVLKLSQYLLLQTAADDALVRLQQSNLSQEDIEYFMNIYYKNQHHRSISEFLQYECGHNDEMFMQVTTHSPLMTHEELETISSAIAINFAHFDLHEFDTELDFSNKIGPKFLREESEAEPFLVIIQCDSGHLNYDLIACARYRIYDEAIRAKNKNRINNRQDVTHILFVIRLPQQEVKSQFVGFQGDPWISVHIDDLRPTSEATVIPEQALTATISELFLGRFEDRKEEDNVESLTHEDEMQETHYEMSMSDEFEESEPEGDMILSTEQRKPDSDEMEISEEEDMRQESSELSGTDSYNSSELAYKDSALLLPPPLVPILSVDKSSVAMQEDIMEDLQEPAADQNVFSVVSLPSIESLQQQEDDDDMEHTSSNDLLLPSLAAQPNLPVASQLTLDSLASTSISGIVSSENSDTLTFPSAPEAHVDEPMTMPKLDLFEPELEAAVLHEEEGLSQSGMIVEEPNVIKSKVEHAPFHPQHRRLLGCVQAAVSILKDSEKDRAMERIQKLMHLIPKSPPTSLDADDTSFYSLLVKFIYGALKQRERDRVDEKDWVLMEAMSGRKLQSGGTFRNVLARRIDEVIIPYFAEIIAYIDQNCNLDLLNEQGNQISSVSEFWLAMFELTGSRIDFSSMAQGKTTIKTDFHCKLPFSWVVKDAVDAQRANISTGANQRLGHLRASICESLSQTEEGAVLERVSEEDVPKFYKFYLNDFVRYVHKSSHSNKLGDMEYRLITEALDAMTRTPDLCSVDGHESLPRKITALHLMYNQCHSEILRFGQLVLHRPGILQSLSSMDPSIRAGLEFTLHLCAVEKVLESPVEKDNTTQNLAGLKPPLKKDEPAQNLQRWLNHVRLSQNVIDMILSSSGDSDIAIKSKLTWQRIRAVQMFVEKVFLPHSDVEGMHFFPRRLDIHLERNSDFLKKETLEAVKLLLNKMDTGKTLKTSESRKRKIKESCFTFFIEVVSSLCFGAKVAPEPDLIKVLLDTVLRENQTSKLTPYKRQEPDDTPTIRSFLLQLLLEHNPDQVREYLDDYFQRSCNIIGGPNIDQGLCLLCIQCFEDALRKRVCAFSIEDKEYQVIQALEEGYTSLQKFSRSDSSISLEYLEAIASVRFGLSALAKQLKHGRTNEELLHVAQALCTDMNINVVDASGKTDTTGPVVYLLKLIVRQFGFPCLKNVSQAHPWVVPKDLRRGEEEQSIDPFVIYGKAYQDLRDGVNTAMFAKKVDDLTTLVQANTDMCLLAVAIYQQATLSRASSLPVKHIQPEAVQILDDFVRDCNLLTPDMMQVLRLLLVNQQGGPLAQMTISPRQPTQCRSFSAIVVHTAAVVGCRQNVELLLPFTNIFNNPTALINAFLPTMPEDMFQEVRKAGGTFYECPNGHPYFVGECGRPVEQKSCRECGAGIGGTNHTLLSSNRGARATDTTKTGYDLGNPNRRSINPERERHLSAPAVCIVRAIMHSAFIWASCNNQHDIVNLAQVVKGQVLPQDLPEFFWMHLEKDIECLRRITGRGIDECAMIIHLVLGRMLSANPSSSPLTGSVKHLGSKDARKEWERLFSGSYIDPVLQNVEGSIKLALDEVANDDKQEHDQLFYLAYERVKVDESRLESHLWTFRSQITLDHLRNTLQGGTSVKILEAFLQAEPSLRATQYLPDIVKLQHFLFDTFDRRLEKSKAETQTIKEFLREIKNENTRNECRELIDSLKKAWALVGQKLKHHNRLAVEEQYLLPAITNDTRLLYLIPTTMGEGRCTTSLVDFLVLTHNDFIEKCRGIVSSGSSSAVWREHKVPITHIHRCHLLDFDQHLQSIILSHCHYSLTVGKGQDIKYDLPALEKHILNRFIYGKPTILADIRHVAYRKDIYTAETFLAIRQKVKPQVAIPQRVQQDIITELRTPDRLRETLDVVDIVLGFLSSGGGNPNITLKKYIDSHKMRRKSFSAKAKENCTLGHIISLWETISVELARQLWLTGQEPFEGIPENYSRDLSKNQITELDKCLRTFDLGLLLGSLFEYIEVHVKHTTAKEEDWALVEAVEFYWDMPGQNALPRFTEEFPTSIKVDQAVSAWKHVVNYQVKRD